MTTPSKQSGHTLRPAIGAWGLAATVINITIGSSVFVFPAVAGAKLGPAAILAYLVAAGAMALIALCFAEAGSRVTGTGGAYAYVEAAFGPAVGWIVGLLIYLGVQLIAAAVVGTVFVRSIAVLVPAIGHGPLRVLVLAVIYATFAAVNVRGGAKTGARVVEAVTFAKLAPLALLIVVGAFASRLDYLHWVGMPPLGDVGRMAMRLIYLFAGLESALSLSGELRDPSRTVPRGVLGGLGLVTAIYLGVQLAAQGLLGPALGQHTEAPLADAARVALGDVGGTIILIGAAISTLGYLSADMLASPRVLFAMGQSGRLPRVLARVHPRFDSPAVAIICHSALVLALAIVADFDTLTTLSSSAILTIYLVSCAATLVLRRRRVGESGVALRLPGGPVIPLLAMAVVAALMSTLALREIVALLIVIAGGIASYLITSRKAAGP